METFLKCYRKHLKVEQEKRTIPKFDIPRYLLKIEILLKQSKMGFDQKSPAIKSVCKELGIPNTYKAIFDFIRNTADQP